MEFKRCKKANENLNELAHRIRVILDKSKCYDRFQKTKVNGTKMYTQKRTIKDVI